MGNKSNENDRDTKGFITFFSHADLLRELSPEEFKRVVLAIYESAEAMDFVVPDDFNSLEKVVYKSIVGDVERSMNRYEERRKKRSEAGKKGMASRWAKKNKKDEKNDGENNKNNNVISCYNKNNSVIDVIESESIGEEKIEHYDFPSAGVGMQNIMNEPLWSDKN